MFEDVFFYLKMSILQFLTKNGFSFYDKNRDIIFNSFTNDKKLIQNGITITEDNDIVITSWIDIDKNFMSFKKLLHIANLMNEISGIFACYVQKTKRGYTFSLRFFLHLLPGTVIDDNFWKLQLLVQTNNVSIITNFLFSIYPKSKFFNNREVESERFRHFFIKKIEEYLRSLKIFSLIENTRKENKKIDYNSWTKEDIDREIDKELDKYKEGKLNKDKLDLLVSILREKDKK